MIPRRSKSSRTQILIGPYARKHIHRIGQYMLNFAIGIARRPATRFKSGL
jgi:hypothetical protein